MKILLNILGLFSTIAFFAQPGSASYSFFFVDNQDQLIDFNLPENSFEKIYTPDNQTIIDTLTDDYLLEDLEWEKWSLNNYFQCKSCSEEAMFHLDSFINTTVEGAEAFVIKTENVQLKILLKSYGFSIGGQTISIKPFTPVSGTILLDVLDTTYSHEQKYGGYIIDSETWLNGIETLNTVGNDIDTLVKIYDHYTTKMIGKFENGEFRDGIIEVSIPGKEQVMTNLKFQNGRYCGDCTSFEDEICQDGLFIGECLYNGVIYLYDQNGILMKILGINNGRLDPNFNYLR